MTVPGVYSPSQGGKALRIEALNYDQHSMTFWAVRNDGVRLRLKHLPPAYVKRRGVKHEEYGPIEYTYWVYDPIKAANEWLGFA